MVPQPDLVRAAGYPLEEHSVVTEDGYILGLHRIPHGLEGEGGPHTARPPVLLHHGLLSSSADFLVNSPPLGTPLTAQLSPDTNKRTWM